MLLELHGGQLPWHSTRDHDEVLQLKLSHQASLLRESLSQQTIRTAGVTLPAHFLSLVRHLHHHLHPHPHPSLLTPHSSHLTPHTSHLTPHSSRLTPRPRPSHLTPTPGAPSAWSQLCRRARLCAHHAHPLPVPPLTTQGLATVQRPAVGGRGHRAGDAPHSAGLRWPRRRRGRRRRRRGRRAPQQQRRQRPCRWWRRDGSDGGGLLLGVGRGARRERADAGLLLPARGWGWTAPLPRSRSRAVVPRRHAPCAAPTRQLGRRPCLPAGTAALCPHLLPPLAPCRRSATAIRLPPLLSAPQPPAASLYAPHARHPACAPTAAAAAAERQQRRQLHARRPHGARRPAHILRRRRLLCGGWRRSDGEWQRCWRLGHRRRRRRRWLHGWGGGRRPRGDHNQRAAGERHRPQQRRQLDLPYGRGVGGRVLARRDDPRRGGGSAVVPRRPIRCQGGQAAAR